MNVAYKGILKTSFEILKWFNTGKNIEQEFKMSAMLMEKAGTGGALFRNLYRDFLKQSYELLQLNNLKTGYESFIEIAELWTSVSRLFEKVSETNDVRYIHQAADVLKAIADKEKRTMELLASL